MLTEHVWSSSRGTSKNEKSTVGTFYGGHKVTGVYKIRNEIYDLGRKLDKTTTSRSLINVCFVL